MSLPANALITVAQANAQGVSGVDADIETLIGIASDIIDTYCSRPLLYAADILEFPDLDGDGDGRSWQNLGNGYLRTIRRPIAEVSSVKIYNDLQTIDTIDENTELPLHNAPDTVWLHTPWLNTGKLFRVSGWPPGNVMITYSAGYWGPGMGSNDDSITTVPERVIQAAGMTVANLSNLIARGHDIQLTQEKTPGDWDRTWRGHSLTELVPPMARSLLAEFKINQFR